MNEEDADAELEEVDVEPCPVCGSWVMWENIFGEWRCRKCHPPYGSSKKFLADMAAARKRAMGEA